MNQNQLMHVLIIWLYSGEFHVTLMDGNILTSKLEYTRKFIKKNTSTMWSLVVKFIPLLLLLFTVHNFKETSIKF